MQPACGGQLQEETLTGGPCRGSSKAMLRCQAPNIEELWRYLWADNAAELHAEGVSREECIQGWGNILLAEFPRQTSVPHSRVAVWL